MVTSLQYQALERTIFVQIKYMEPDETRNRLAHLSYKMAAPILTLTISWIDLSTLISDCTENIRRATRITMKFTNQIWSAGERVLKTTIPMFLRASHQQGNEDWSRTCGDYAEEEERSADQKDGEVSVIITMQNPIPTDPIKAHIKVTTTGQGTHESVDALLKRPSRAGACLCVSHFGLLTRPFPFLRVENRIWFH